MPKSAKSANYPSAYPISQITQILTEGILWRFTFVSLDLDRLEKPRVRSGKVIARCPACAEMGADRSCEHLFIADEGRGPFGCILFEGAAGDAHRKRIWELVGVRGNGHSAQYVAMPKHQSAPAKGRPRLPPLRPLNVAEMAIVALLRGWPAVAGLKLLSQRRLLWYGDVFDGDREWPAWIVTDSARRNAQARRLDGLPWPGIGGAKAKSLPGSDPSWPIGAAEISGRAAVLFCEGGPDFLASLLVAWWEGGRALADSTAPVCITGAGNDIHRNALPLFAGKHVRIAVHADDQGRDAGQRWADQLHGAGAANVDSFDFTGLALSDGKPVKDLADFATLLDLENPQAIEVFSGLNPKPPESPLLGTEAGIP